MVDDDLDARLSALEAVEGVDDSRAVEVWVREYLKSVDRFSFNISPEGGDGDGWVTIARGTDGRVSQEIPEGDIPAWIDADADLPVLGVGSDG
jgi:hypothetical protein